MKNILALLTAILMVSCTPEPVKITVENPLDFDRNGEMVEVRTKALKADFVNQTYVLKNEKGEEIPYQLWTEGSDSLLIFQADVPGGKSSIYTLEKGTPAPVAAKTHARQVPERKDDFAWENDLAAYRMYGPALAPENPSNGVDLWLKCTDSLVMDKFYADELERGISYHVNHGLGLDCYSVGHTMGAGGIAPYTGQAWIGNHYDRFEVKAAGPLRSVFTLIYDSIRVDKVYYKAILTVTADAGSLMNKAVVRYEGPDAPLKLAAGIFLHKEKGRLFSSEDKQVIAYSENAVSDAGIPQGLNYVGIYIPGADGGTLEENDHFMLLKKYSPGQDFVYYFGGGWSQWKFPTADDWFDAVVRFGLVRKAPLKAGVQ
ncbi:MAG: DUF4861 domain-containing protein [Dysgonamonadaceae bacterium]|nr:DUF4861 domain-containing protein [Dysgonamonadaceae bacterium]